MSAKPVTVLFRLSRRIGVDTLEFEITALADPGNENHEYNRIMGIVRTALGDYMQNVAPSLPTAPRENDAQQPGEWFKVVKLSVTVDGGKRYVKAHAGKYAKHGVVIWPEVAKEIGLDLDKIPNEGYAPQKNLEAMITTNPEGKARVSHLRIGE